MTLCVEEIFYFRVASSTRARLIIVVICWIHFCDILFAAKILQRNHGNSFYTIILVFWALRKQEEQRLHNNEMKMLRWSQGKTRKDRIKNETIRGNAKVSPINSVRTQKRLSWYGHVMRHDKTHITKSTLSTTVTGTRPRGRPKMRWLDRLKSDMRIYDINSDMATDRKRWAVMVKNVDTTQMVEYGNG